MSRVIVVDPCPAARETLGRRLCAQGYSVDEAADAVAAADMALSSPPLAVVADLWMPGVSGVQLCRLLKSEPATADLPVILRGEIDDPRSRFWAARAGAVAYVPKGRVGELVRALALAAGTRPAEDAFFMQLSGPTDVRDRIAQSLDDALFESIIASEVRALASAGSLDRLFDLFSQFLSQVLRYRWLAMHTSAPQRFAVHHHPRSSATAEREARDALACAVADVPMLRIEDEDASDGGGDGDGKERPLPLVRTICFAGAEIGRVAVAALEDDRETTRLLDLVARELGGAIRMAALIEDSQRLATIDPLTGIMNRRAFTAAMAVELSRSTRHGLPLSVLLLDVDHFKAVNDLRGHACGDRVLSAIGALLRRELRVSDLGARWGGEEFVIALPSTSLADGVRVADRLRERLAALEVVDDGGDRIPVTGSFGITALHGKESLESLIERADKAMYEAKHSGRNRVCTLPATPPAASEPAAREDSALAS